MIAKLVVQVSRAGERHVVFTQDPLVSTEELLLTAPGWEDAVVTVGRVLMLGMDETDEALDALLETELHSAEMHYVPKASKLKWKGQTK